MPDHGDAVLRDGQPGQPRLQAGKAGNVKRFAELAAAEDVWMIEFRESRSGDAVSGANNRDLPSHGEIWVDRTQRSHPADRTDQRGYAAARDGRCAYKSAPGSRLPGAGRDARDLSIRINESRIDGRATYSKFRQFTVTTSEKPKPSDHSARDDRRRRRRSGASFMRWSPAATPTRFSPTHQGPSGRVLHRAGHFVVGDRRMAIA